MNATSSANLFSENSTVFAAWFGAIVSFLLFVFEIYKYRNDKGRLSFRIGYNMQVMGNHFGNLVNLSQASSFWSITIANTGSRDIVFNQLSFENKSKDGMDWIMASDYNGQINIFTLKPGESHNFTIDYKTVDPHKVKRVVVMDAVGKLYKKTVKRNF